MNIKYTRIRRVRITAPISERTEVLDYLYRNGYKLRTSGPKPLGAGRADITMLVVVAEKEV